MQLHGAFAKRKSFQNLEPEMPKRKISQNSRQGSRRKHRTQHKTINSPEIQLHAYKRKNLIVLNQISAAHQSENKSTKQRKLQQLRTNRTKQSINFTENSSIIEKSQKPTINQSNRHHSNSKNSSHSQINDKKLNLKNREESTSRFTINHNEIEEDSLSTLIHQTKSQNSNPLINTARLKQDQHQKKGENIFGFIQIKNNQKIQNQRQNENTEQLMKKALHYDLYQNDKRFSNDSNIKQNDFQDQKQSLEGENFDDYEFGGAQNSQQIKINQHSNKKIKKTKFKLQPPKSKAYGTNDMINQKPENWRELNRYIPRSQSQHRMGLQIIKNQKAALQSKRQKQQIIGLLQEYQMNKNSIHLLSQRKIQSNKIIQNFYRERRINSEKKNSTSLPFLKAYSQQKTILLIPDAEKIHKEIKNFKLGQADSMQTMIKKIEQKSKVRSSLSFTKLGFGSSNPRPINQEDLNQNELQNVRNIQKKLRQKGIQFNVDSLRKGLLNIRDGPVSKMSKNGSYEKQKIDLINQHKLQFPEKQLPSNGFYKIFPL